MSAESLVAQMKTGLDAPICLTWELTYACNLQCVHCLSSSGQRDPRELTTAEAKRVLDELHDHIHRGLALGPAFVERLNQTDRELRPRLLEHNAAVKAAALRELASGG